MNADNLHIETVEQPIDESQRDRIYAFWLQQLGKTDRGAATQRLLRVLAVGRDGDGAVVASCSAIPARVAALGSQTLLVYRSLLSPAVSSAETWVALVERAWQIVERRRAEGEHTESIGLLVPVTEPSVSAARPEAVWAKSGLIHAGYGQGGIGLRVRYFSDARLSTGVGA